MENFPSVHDSMPNIMPIKSKTGNYLSSKTVTMTSDILIWDLLHMGGSPGKDVW